MNSIIWEWQNPKSELLKNKSSGSGRFSPDYIIFIYTFHTHVYTQIDFFLPLLK